MNDCVVDDPVVTTDPVVVADPASDSEDDAAPVDPVVAVEPTPAPVEARTPAPTIAPIGKAFFYIKNVDSGLVVDVSEPVKSGVHAALTKKAGL